MGRRNHRRIVWLCAAFAVLGLVGPGLADPPQFWPQVFSSVGFTVPVASGIAYSHFGVATAAGPLNIHHLRIDLDNPTVRLGVGLAHDQLMSDDETVSSMVRRSGAIAGMNGDYFDIHESGMPLNILVREGQLLRSPVGWVALTVGKDGGARIVRFRWTGSVVISSTAESYWLAGYNSGFVPDGIVALSNVRGYGAPVPDPGVQQTVVELAPAIPAPPPASAPVSAPPPPPPNPDTGSTGSTTSTTSTDSSTTSSPPPPGGGTSESGGDSAQPAAPPPEPSPPVPSAPAAPEPSVPVAPEPSAPVAPENDSGQYTVKQVWPQQAFYAPFPKGEILLVGRGSAAGWLQRKMTPGTAVQVNLTTDPDWHPFRVVLGGGPMLVQDGRIAQDPYPPAPGETDRRYPVVAAGLARGGRILLLTEVDGRRPRASVGLTRPELAGYMQWLGADQAIAFDSGGSATMVARLPGQAVPTVVNSPSDGRERPVANALLIYSTSVPGPAVRILVNASQTLRLFAGAAVPLSIIGVDDQGNPVPPPAAVTITASPPLAAATPGGLVRAGRTPGAAVLQVQSGPASGTAPISVVIRLRQLAISPPAVALPPRARATFTLAGLDVAGNPVVLPDRGASWSVVPRWLGTVAGTGQFIAGPRPGHGTITVQLGGAASQVRVAVRRR